MSSVKRKLVVKTLAQKCKALKELEQEGATHKSVALKYGVPRNTITTWVKNKEKYFSALEKSSNKRRKIREGTNKDLDAVVFKWFLAKRSQNIPIDGSMIKEKALGYAKELGVSSDFRASDGWLHRWKKRYEFLFIAYILYQYFYTLFSTREN